MRKSGIYDFNLPSRETGDIADINKITENFAKIEEILVVDLEQTKDLYAEKQIENSVDISGLYTVNKIDDSAIPDTGDFYSQIFTEPSLLEVAKLYVYFDDANLLSTGDKIRIEGTTGGRVSVYKVSKIKDAIVTKEILGEIETVLDRVIDIQESLIGGVGV